MHSNPVPVAKHPMRRPALFLLMVLALLALAACNLPGRGANDAAADDGAVEVSAAESAATSPTPITIAATDESFNGLPVGFTEEGWPFRGNPSAPVTMYEFSDFQCPFCNRYFVQTEPAINETYVQDGRLRVVFRDLPLDGLHPNAPAAHEAAACVAEQGAALYWDMHNKLFEAQDEWAEQADPQPTFARLVDEVGADGAAWQECVESDRTVAAIQASVEAAAALGFDGTPSFRFETSDGLEFQLVGAQPFDRFATAIDALLAGEAPAGEAATAPDPGIPFWATSEGLAVDPARPGYTVAGDFTRGADDAPVVVVEFTDFQCPYCERHHAETQPVLDAQFVESGQVRWVFKHFPLSIHLQAPAAGAAAECAAQQGQFWEMGDALFASVDRWSINEPNPVFGELAGELGLDADAFAACLNDPTMLAAVETDAADGAAYVQGTPTFIVRYGSEGRIIPGALPEATFVNELEKVLAEVEGS